MKTKFFLGLIVILFISFSFKSRPFPLFDTQTITGKSVSNAIFDGHKTIVVLFHLGCPAAMLLLKDIEEAKKNNVLMPQIIAFAENTPEQIIQFNDTTNNDWSQIRKYFNLNPLTIDIVGECSVENIAISKEGDIIIGEQCRILSKKIKTKVSPTLVYVDETGTIVKIDKKGFIISKNYQETIENINVWKK